MPGCPDQSCDLAGKPSAGPREVLAYAADRGEGLSRIKLPLVGIFAFIVMAASGHASPNSVAHLDRNGLVQGDQPPLKYQPVHTPYSYGSRHRALITSTAATLFAYASSPIVH